jgi:tetratricopeptide (TPR) repeat protein
MSGRTFCETLSLPLALLVVLGACSAQNNSPEAFSKTLDPLRSPTYEQNGSLSNSALKLNLLHQFLLFQVKRQKGLEAEASPLLDKVTQADPASAHLQLLAAREALRAGDLEAAEVLVSRAYTYKPNDSEIRRELASILASRDKFSEAYLHVEKLLESDPADESVLSLAVNLDIRRDDYWAALKRLERALQSSEAPEALHYRMGRVYRDMGRSKEARQAFEKAIKVNPAHYQAATYLAILYEEAGNESRALELYEGLANLTNNALYHRKLSSLYMKRKDYSKAIESFQNLLQIEPTDMNSLLQMARAWIELGDLDKSEEKFRELIQLDPSNGTLRLMLGMLLETQSRTEEALEHYLQIESDSSAYYDSMGLRLKALHGLDQKQQLLEHLEKSVSLAGKVEDSQKALALFRVASQYYSELQNYPRSEQVLLSALKRFPGNEILLYQKGILLEKMRRYEEGVKVMLSILSVNPDHVGALNYVGYTWADQDMNLDEAEEFITKALSMAPEDPYITDSLGWLYYRQGRYELAYETLRKAYQAVPKEFVIVEHLGDVLVKLGRLSEARDYYAKALRLKPEHQDMRVQVEKKLAKVDSKLPPDSRMGHLESFCDGLVNRRCNTHRMQFDEARSRTPSAETGTRSQ